MLPGDGQVVAEWDWIRAMNATDLFAVAMHHHCTHQLRRVGSWSHE
jgi:hypothetical protein